MSWVDLAGAVKLDTQPKQPDKKRRNTLPAMPMVFDRRRRLSSSLHVSGFGRSATSPEKEELKFDDVLLEVGDFGLYQKRLMFLVCLTAGCVSFQISSPIFTMKIPPHRCKLPGYPNDTFELQNPYHESLVNKTIPVTDGKLSECKMFDVNKTAGNPGKSETETECSEWVYDKSVFTSTVVTDLDLVCSNTIYRSHTSMMISAGKFVGALASSIAGDYFGRRSVYTFMMLGLAVSSVGVVFAYNVPLLMACRFVAGASSVGASISCSLISSELLGTSKRRWTSVATRISSVLVKLMITLLAFFLRDWHYFQASLAVPVVFVLAGFFFVPESPRWLVSKGRFKEAQKVLDAVAKANGKVPTSRFEQGAIHTIRDVLAKQETKKTASPLSLFRVPRLTKRYIFLYFAWILTAMCSFGLALNVSNMSGDIFVNFLLLTAADVVALFLFAGLVEHVGRRPLIVGVSGAGGLACLATILPVALGGSDWILRLLSLGGRVYVSTGTPGLHTMSFELFPTVLASFGLGSCNMLSRVGGLASPYVADLSLYVKGAWGPALPQIVFGVSGLVTAILVFTLPETKGRLLPETVQDAENFGRNEVIQTDKKANGTIKSPAENKY